MEIDGGRDFHIHVDRLIRSIERYPVIDGRLGGPS
jgi:hypothetical protein